MLTARGQTNTGQDLIFLGITAEDLVRLISGETMHIDTTDPKPGGMELAGGPVLTLRFGDTAETLVRMIRDEGRVTAETEAFGVAADVLNEEDE